MAATIMPAPPINGLMNKPPRIGLSPAHKFYGELERPLRRGKECILVEAQRFVEQADLWDCRFTDANRPNLFGFNQCNMKAIFEEMAHRSRNHPTGGSTPGNYDMDHIVVSHRSSLRQPPAFHSLQEKQVRHKRTPPALRPG